ncbi:fimbrial biogenesis usher protein [Lelliottia wanjuensis]|uniref:fimbrial biogenesis usher protein n=1 Tax=Lelliottia wanjuensis TaxID=3050585 RepID=UPI00254CB88B|nr:fimbrial biogenesis usher protein [Lelliottia sp. V104_15]MDK9605798.1 fimbrial biogenesis usher protein [Lelliottia sp. V104_15]
MKNVTRISGVLFLAVNYSAHAEYRFNPAFLASDPSAIADLGHLQSGGDVAPGKYKVDVYVNGSFVSSMPITFVSLKNKSTDQEEIKPVFSVAQLALLGIRTNTIEAFKQKESSDIVSVEEGIPSSKVTFDLRSLRVDLSIPQIVMRNDARGYIPPEQWDQGINALLLNYNLTGNKDWYDSGAAQSNFLSLQSGLNLGAWRLRDSTTWNRNEYTSGESQSKWEHISTYVERDIESLKGELTAGDTSTRGDIFDSYPLRGVKVESDENMLPDSLRGFAPTIKGIARGNAKVTIRQNNYLVYQTYVPGGAFEINDLFPTSSSGDLQVTVTESDGSTHTFTVPYSSVPGLQREGHITYSVSAGKYHSGNDTQDDPDVAQATFMWGLGLGYTFYGGTQMSDNYQSVAVGVGKNLGVLGALSADLTSANSTLSDGSKHSGQSVRFLYAKSLNELGTTFNITGYRYSTEGFYTLADTTYKDMSGYNSSDDDSLDDTGDKNDEPDYANYYDLWYTKKGKLQMSINQSIGGWGSFYISGTEQTYWHTDNKDTYFQAGYSSSFNDVTYSINYNYNKYMSQPVADQIVSMNVSVPIGKWLMHGDNSGSHVNNAYLTSNTSTDHDGRTTQSTGISGTLLDEGNLNYNVQQGYTNQGEGLNGNANLSYNGAYNNMTVGYSYDHDSHQVNYGLAGGVILHRNGITFGQPLGDTNILVAAPGAVGVGLENNRGVKTDWRGYAIVPYASTYRLNRVALNTQSLDTHTDIESSVVNVVPTPGAVVRARFTAHTGERVLMTLLHGNRPVPFGAMVTGGGRKEAAIVGDDGQVYLPGLVDSGSLLAQWGSSKDDQCVITYEIPEAKVEEPIVRMNGQCQ